jgi:hypothetical protein
MTTTTCTARVVASERFAEVLRDLAAYTRELEEELDGEGEALIAANSLLVEIEDSQDLAA